MTDHEAEVALLVEKIKSRSQTIPVEDGKLFLKGAYLKGAYFRDFDLRNINLENANLENAKLKNVKLENVNLSGANLKNATFEDVILIDGNNLNNVNLQSAKLENVNFSQINLLRANLKHAKLKGAAFINTFLEDTDFSFADLRDTEFMRAYLSLTILRGTDLRGANLENAQLSNADLTGANLEGHQLQHYYLRHTNLRSAKLRNANLEGADLIEAILRDTDLIGANLRSADLEGADLEGAYLINTDLDNAKLKGANLNGANLNGANLFGANLNGAILTDTVLDLSRYGLPQDFLDKMYLERFVSKNYRQFFDCFIKKLFAIINYTKDNLTKVRTGIQEKFGEIDYTNKMKPISSFSQKVLVNRRFGNHISSFVTTTPKEIKPIVNTIMYGMPKYKTLLTDYTSQEIEKLCDEKIRSLVGFEKEISKLFPNQPETAWSIINTLLNSTASWVFSRGGNRSKRKNKRGKRSKKNK